eukprot:21216-Chlamydomonas_euryale.AAC.27
MACLVAACAAQHASTARRFARPALEAGLERARGRQRVCRLPSAAAAPPGRSNSAARSASPRRAASCLPVCLAHRRRLSMASLADESTDAAASTTSASAALARPCRTGAKFSLLCSQSMRAPPGDRAGLPGAFHDGRQLSAQG